MNTLSFMTANYVARPLGYHMQDWGYGDRATNEYFRPVETYAARFGEMLADIRALGFAAVDVWLSHLNYSWATDEHIALACEELKRRNLTVTSLGGWLGSTPAEFERTCQIAVALGTRLLGSTTSMLKKDRPFVIATLRRYGLKLGIENHPEKTPDEVIEQIGDETDVMGACVDTGWFGTQGYDVPQALVELGEHVLHVHLKDVLAAGEHKTCRYGRGIVPIEECVMALQSMGYTGAITVEHEPEDFDPTEDIRASREMLAGWLNH